MTERLDITTYEPPERALLLAERAENTAALEMFSFFLALAHDPEGEPHFEARNLGSARRRVFTDDPSISLEAILFYSNSKGYTDPKGKKLQLGYHDADGGASLQVHEYTAAGREFDGYDQMILNYFRAQYPHARVPVAEEALSHD